MSHPAVIPKSDLQRARRILADAAYENHEFGKDIEICGQDGWEQTIPGTEMSRTVYHLPKGSALDADQSARGTFTVTFRTADSADIAGVRFH